MGSTRRWPPAGCIPAPVGSDGAVSCWGNDNHSQSQPARRAIHGGGGRGRAQLRRTSRRHHRLLVRQLGRPERPARRGVQRRDRGHVVLVRNPDRWHGGVLGLRRRSGRAPRGTHSALSAPGVATSAGCAPTAPSPAGSSRRSWRLRPALTAVTGADPGSCRPLGVHNEPHRGVPAAGVGSVTRTGPCGWRCCSWTSPTPPASHTTQREAEIGLPVAEEYLETSSYGNLDVEFVPLHRWLRADHNRFDA